MELPEPSQPLLLGIALLLGLLVGSFLNVVIHRLPQGLSVVRPRSHCPACETAIAARDNVPVLSWIWLRGRCRHFRAPISWRYPAVELVTGLLFLGVVARHGLAPTTPLWLAFVALLLAAALIDAEYQIIPDELSLGGAALGLAGVPLVHALAGEPWGQALDTAWLGALLGGGLLWTAGFVHARLSVVAVRRFEHWPGPGEDLPRPASLDYWIWFPGLGFGDVKLFLAIGAFVGPLGVLHVLWLSAMVGLVLGLAWLALRRQAGMPFGFAPAIAAGALLVVLFPSLGELGIRL